MNNRIVTSLCASCAILCAIQRASAQGNLTPPGPPAPTMKSLDQLESRTPISSVPYTITAPGSYYLTTNLTVTTGSAITITASQVTLDLIGFTLSSTEATPTGSGILLAGGDTDITILNGHIKGGVTYSGGNYTGPSFANGIYYSGSAPVNVLVSHVSVSGCSTYGIFLGLGNSTVVESCMVQTIGGYGVEANTITHSAANLCGNVAMIANIASDSYANSTGAQGLSAALSANNCYGVGSGIGLYAKAAINCTGQSNGSSQGLYAITADNCQGQSASGVGLYATQSVTGCYGTSGSGDGLDATTANNCQGQSSGSGYGLNASQTATGCYGASNTGTGLSATTAANCTGQSTGALSPGLAADTADNCYGINKGNGTGLNATFIATGCVGTGPSGGLFAFIANSCFSSTGDGDISHPYNMP